LRRVFGPPRRKRGCLFPILLLVLIAAGIRLLSEPFLTACASYLIEDDGPRKADAILVLGGDRYGDRTLKGAELAKAGYAPVVYVDGPPRLMGYESTDEVTYAEQKGGYPPAVFKEVHLPEDAESTRTEMMFVGKSMAADGIKSILLVTSNFHTRRAAKLWRQVNPNINVTVVASSDPYFTPTTWWKTRPGQKTFVYEWLKTISVMFGI